MWGHPHAFEKSGERRAHEDEEPGRERDRSSDCERDPEGRKRDVVARHLPLLGQSKRDGGGV